MQFGPPHLCLKRSCVRCKHIILEHVLGHVLCQWQREATAECLSAWQRRDLFVLQVVIHCPQYYFAVIRNPGTAGEMEPYCANCFLKYETRESHPFDYLTLVNASLCFQKRNASLCFQKKKEIFRLDLKTNASPWVRNHLINWFRDTRQGEAVRNRRESQCSS